MDWNNIISSKRTGGSSSSNEERTNFQVDFDRLIFSSAFRRLQGKTQVFPLPGSVFVHNRLTHSLEVASVGRSLGKIAGSELVKSGKISEENQNFYQNELANVIAAACLAHDIGNPPFGHSGETSISDFFKQNAGMKIEGKELISFFTGKQKEDLLNFEGNANSFRILVKQFNGKHEGGFGLTYTTLASIMKYPWFAQKHESKPSKTSKFGFFISETGIATEILSDLNVKKLSSDVPVFARHPFVYLTEAADDICYRILDFEDAHRLKIISHSEVSGLFREVLKSINPGETDRIKSKLDKISDKNEQISYLRAKCINGLIHKTADVFNSCSEEIIEGKYIGGLVDILENEYPVLKEIKEKSINDIYNYETVIQLEIAGHKVMSDLLSLFIPAVLKSSPDVMDKKILRLVPEQFKTPGNANNYEKVLSVLDYFSGMTDDFIIDLHRKLSGIEIPRHR